MTTFSLGRSLSALTLSAALAGSTLLATVPTTALAVPAGGYGDLVEQLSPSVVYIEVTARAEPADIDSQLPPGFPREELERRFGPMFPEQGEGRPVQGVGSGFIISADGQIVTNNHVIDGAETIEVRLADGTTHEATLVGTDPLTDIALLKIDTDEDLPFVTMGDSDAMRAGDEVLAIGNPFGLGGTVTSGIISAINRDIRSGPYDDFIQTDAAINRGNSGGPLFNNAGEVIGVNTMIYSPGGGSVGIGFAVPSDLVQTVVADLADDGTIARGWLGVQIRPMTEDVAQLLGYDAPKGAVVEAVQDDSPAAAAGLVEGDIILSFAGTEISDLGDLTRAVADTAPGSEAQMVVFRKGAEEEIAVTVGNLADRAS